MAPYTKEALNHLKWQSRVFIALNIVAAIALAVLFILIRHQQSGLHAQAALIQRERADSIRTQCQEQNRRHDETIRQLRGLLDRNHTQSALRKRASFANTVLLINALQPKLNCAKRVEKFVSGA